MWGVVAQQRMTPPTTSSTEAVKRTLQRLRHRAAAQSEEHTIQEKSLLVEQVWDLGDLEALGYLVSSHVAAAVVAVR